MRAELIARLEGPLKEAWPPDGAELTAYELGLDTDGIIVRIRYKSAAPLDEVAQRILSKVLQARLQVSKLRLLCDYEPPVPAPAALKLSSKRRK